MRWCAEQWTAADKHDVGFRDLARDPRGGDRPELQSLALPTGANGKQASGSSGGSSSGSDFYALLHELATEHAREVRNLRAQLTRTQCGVYGASCVAPPCQEADGSTSGAIGIFGRRTDVEGRGRAHAAPVDEPGQASIDEAASSFVEGPTRSVSDLLLVSEEKEQNRHDSETDEQYRLRPLWNLERRTAVSGTFCVLNSQVNIGESDGLMPKMTYHGRFKSLIAEPSSPTRLIWDFAGAFFILLDLIMIPVVQVFEPPGNACLTVLDWVTLTFWTVNIPMSLMVGYVHEGVTVMVPSLILKRYLSTWFLIDMLVVVPDWVFTILEFRTREDEAHSSPADSVKLLRILRLLRMARLLRLLKLRKVLVAINEMIDTEYTSIMANILAMILLLLLITHVISCAWFAIGSNQDFSETWLKFYGLDGEPWYYQYFTALHWSITQFTPASMEITPKNLYERMFTIAVVVFALVGFSYVVGSITGSLTQLRGLQEDQSRQFWDLRRYLKQNKVQSNLSQRIQRYLEHAWTSQHSRLPVKSVKILNLLSEQLTCELQSELYVPYTSVHPFFEHLNEMSRVTMSRIANLCIVRKALAREDTLFHPAEEATHMYIVALGRLKYVRIERCGTELGTEYVDKGEDWIAEPVLWIVSWPHIGRLTALSVCDLLCVEPRAFGEVVALNPASFAFAQSYCRNLVSWLGSVPSEELSDISQGEEIGDRIRAFMGIVKAVPTDMTENMSRTRAMTTWRQSSRKGSRGRKGSK